jgi:hypothetical protein
MRRSQLLLAAGFLVGLSVGCAQTLAQTEVPSQLPLLDSVSQYGITWKFETKVPVGRFVGGDYYVVGPVTVTDITPRPVIGQDGRNGSMLNPPIVDKGGWDSRMRYGRYDPELCAPLPIRMKPGDSLVSTVSVERTRELPRMVRTSDKASSPILTAAVLTCMDKQPPRDAFRPAYCDTSNKLYRAGSLRRDLLPNLPHVESMESIEKWQRVFQRPWLDRTFDGLEAPIQNMPCYGREIARSVGIATLLLCCDFRPDEKGPLLINVVQVGIDLWGMVRAGHRGWPAHGGHGQGRKWIIVFSGLMLGDEDMQSPHTEYPDVKFSEDMQTMFDKCWTGADVVYAGHVGKDGMEGKIGWGRYEHLNPSQWPHDPDWADGKHRIGEDYRRCCSSLCWVGEALAIEILHAEKVWNHDAFFAYVDRWMTEDDTDHLEIIRAATGADYSAVWQRQGQCWDAFVEQMYARYRHNLPPAGGR